MDDGTGTPGTASERMAGPVHHWFGLSYSSYQVLPRVLMQSMPLPWQHRMVACLEEMRAAFNHVDLAPGYDVRPCSWATPDDLTAADREAAGVQVEHTENDTTYSRRGVRLETGVEIAVPVDEPLPHYRRAFVQPWPAEAAS